MYYEERFKELMKTTAKGFGIGFIISTILSIWVFGLSLDLILGDLILTIFIGGIISIILCSKNGAKEHMSGAISRVWDGMKDLFFSSIFGNNIYFLIFGLFKLFIGVIIMIPVGLFMAVSYFFNLIYLGIMFALEKNNKLDANNALCERLDTLIPILSGVITAVFCILVIKSM